MDGADLVRDASGTRTFSAFLVEMTERCPAAVLPNVSLLLGHLDGEVGSDELYLFALLRLAFGQMCFAVKFCCPSWTE